ncbi:MAG TPA: PhoH family protein [Pseudoneobacillus sp.]|nr:PhoH family protein [Pseudoneobacillus sp.]
MAKLKDNMLFGFSDTITQEQMEFLELMKLPTDQVRLIILEAEAGTGKTQMAAIAAKLRHAELNSPLRYIFAPVQEGKQGFLPGDIVEKSDPYTAPLAQALNKIREKKVIYDPRLGEDHVGNRGCWVYTHPHTFERGKNYEGETVIIDEAQNYTTHELVKILTRCHDNSKVILAGNTKQCDLEDPSSSGFAPFIIHSQGVPWVRKVNFTVNFRGELARWADSIKR